MGVGGLGGGWGAGVALPPTLPAAGWGGGGALSPAAAATRRLLIIFTDDPDFGSVVSVLSDALSSTMDELEACKAEAVAAAGRGVLPVALPAPGFNASGVLMRITRLDQILKVGHDGVRHDRVTPRTMRGGTVGRCRGTQR